MSKRKRFGVSQALTRGLSETIHVVENNAGVFRNAVVPLSRIELDPDNPRKLTIDLLDIRQGLDKNDAMYQRKSEELERLKELAFTIETSGIINPIVVYKRGEVYRIVAGERRCLASVLAGKNEIDARIFNEKPKAFELKLIQWVENTAREDLSLNERMENMREILHEYQLQNENVAVTATLIKNITGLSLSQATYYMAVLQAPEDVRSMIQNGQIRNLDKAAVIAVIESEPLRQEVLRACLNGLSLKELRKMIAQQKQSHSLPVTHSRKNIDRFRINLGSTSPAVVQTLIESVIANPLFNTYEELFAKVEWEKANQATKAFKKLIQLLEQQEV